MLLVAPEEQSRKRGNIVVDAYSRTLQRINVMLLLDLGGSGTVTVLRRDRHVYILSLIHI